MFRQRLQRNIIVLNSKELSSQQNQKFEVLTRQRLLRKT